MISAWKGPRQNYQPTSTLDATIFDPIVLDVKKYKDTAKKIELGPELMEILLNQAVIRDFFTWFLNQDLNAEFLRYEKIRNCSVAEKTDEFRSVSRFRQPNTDKVVTLQGTSPLDEDEYSLARQYLIKNPSLNQAFLIVESGLSAYLDELEKVITTTTGVPSRHSFDGKSTTIFDLLRSGITSRPLMQEFLPLYAYRAHVHTQEERPDEQEICRQGLKDAFVVRRAFTSIEDITKRVIECPFKKAIGPLLNSHFREGKNGAINLDQSMSLGGLISFISRKLKTDAINPRQLPTLTVIKR